MYHVILRRITKDKRVTLLVAIPLIQMYEMFMYISFASNYLCGYSLNQIQSLQQNKFLCKAILLALSLHLCGFKTCYLSVRPAYLYTQHI